MAHDVQGQGPYPAVRAAIDEVKFPCLALVKDPGGLYITESVTEGEDSGPLAEMTCLFCRWAVDEMRGRYGEAAEQDLLAMLKRGLGL